MEDLFKQKLLRLRQPPVPSTFADVLYDGLYFPRSKTKVLSITESAELINEKSVVMNSLKQFAQDNLSEDRPTLNFDGGQIALKGESDWTSYQPFPSVNAMMEQVSLEARTRELCLKSKIPGSVKVLFVTEGFRTWDEVKPEIENQFSDEVLPAFPLKTAKFFAGMLSALKLTSSEFAIYPSDINGQDASQEVIRIAVTLRPELIVTLGAPSAHRILKIQERLSNIHGQFFNKHLASGESLAVVPLFHPSIVETNFQMKRTTWMDMQKIMKHLKKLP